MPDWSSFAILETKAETIAVYMVRAAVCMRPLTKEPGPHGLYHLLEPHVTRVLARDPRKNALLKAGNKTDRIDARELLYLNI